MAGLATESRGALTVLSDVMAIYKRAINVMRSEMPSSIFLLHLLVQESRLSSFVRIFERIIHVWQGDSDNPLKSRVAQEIVGGVSEAMLKAQIEIADKNSWRLVGKIKTQTNMERMELLTSMLTQLNDNLSDLMSPGKLRDLKSSLIDQLWTCSLDGVRALRDAGLGSASLRRAFERIALQLEVWRQDFDFDLPQIEMVLRSNEDLYTCIVEIFERLVNLMRP